MSDRVGGLMNLELGLSTLINCALTVKYYLYCHLSGVMVSVLAMGYKVWGFKPG
jgi:hypothetical protein